MIILDDDQEQLPKLASPPPVHSALIRLSRAATSTPSLPDYETSQKLHRVGIWKHKALSRRWRWAIYGLIAYFVITVAIGVPLIVVKTRKSSTTYKNPSLLYPSPAYGVSNSSISGFDLGTSALCVEEATACNSWVWKDKKSGSSLRAQLEYYIPVTDTVFIQSNVSMPANVTSPPITGSLVVNLSDDPQETNASITVAMSYTELYIRQETKAPEELYAPDKLRINVTLTLPKFNGTAQSVYIPTFITNLPFFTQSVGGLSPKVTFGSVALAGEKSNVTIQSIQAEEIYVKSSFAGVSGTLNSTD
ncbi:hypothetical protein EIP86_003465 [Pleurotus ostreatoroseus]|nr:hypothetical protein EIP86_003465 [Pleurotus ostreatoroseus]